MANHEFRVISSKLGMVHASYIVPATKKTLGGGFNPETMSTKSRSTSLNPNFQMKPPQKCLTMVGNVFSWLSARLFRLNAPSYAWIFSAISPGHSIYNGPGSGPILNQPTIGSLISYESDFTAV